MSDAQLILSEEKIAASKTPKRSDSLEELFSADLEEEKGAIGFYCEAAQAADEDRDIGTRVLFEEILMDEEGHQDWLSQQLNLLKRMGEPTYMLQNMGDGAESG